MKILFRAALVLIALLPAACNGPSIPKPFADHAPELAAVLSPPDSAGIFVLPAEGAPPPSATALANAMATALQASDVPASATASNQRSYRLQPKASSTSLDPTRETVSVQWELRDPDGKVIGSVPARIDASADGWKRGDMELARTLSKGAAPELAKLIQGNAPMPTGGVNPLVALRAVKGAPGDGNQALTRAMGEALKRADLTLTGEPAKSDYVLAGTVEVSPADGQKQKVKVSWILTRPDGSEIGHINQENAVPAGSLNGPWGDVAYAVTNAAAPGVRRLVEEAQIQPAKRS